MKLELRPVPSDAERVDAAQIQWGTPGAASSVTASVDPWLTQIGNVSDTTVDLVRIATAAYLADRMVPRRAGYSRTLEAHVQLMDPTRWQPHTSDVGSLLQWLSNDEWRLSFSQEQGRRPDVTVHDAVAEYEAVALLSGGLDSFCGAILNSATTLYLSHADNPIVKGAQRRCWNWLTGRGLVSGAWLPVAVSEAGTKRERSTRTRALLFYALALAAADAHKVRRVEVPENGFTSINVPLGNERGGVLSTRSTHPWTMHLLRSLLAAVGIDIEITNPYEWLTKGELVAAAAHAPDFSEGAAETLSCAKLDGRFVGGSTHHNCGLCVACITRRGGMVKSGVGDTTPYLSTTLTNARSERLRARRADDILALQRAVATAPTFDEFDLLALGPFPDDFDFAAGAQLVRRGFAELGLALEVN